MIDGPSMILSLCNPLLSNTDSISLIRTTVKEIRKEFGTSVRENCIHASDSFETMVRETAIFFS